MAPGPMRTCPIPSQRRRNAAFLALGALLLGSLLGLLTGPLSAQAQNAFSGTWRIVGSEAAPWAGEASPPDGKAMKALKGKALTFAASKISGPASLACSKPRYEIRQAPPEGLFQGVLAAPPPSSKPPASAKEAARRLGMTSPTVATLSVGCSGIEFHLISANEGLFALNNVVYRMRR
jgi:hypothetical protein